MLYDSFVPLMAYWGPEFPVIVVVCVVNAPVQSPCVV